MPNENQQKNSGGLWRHHGHRLIREFKVKASYERTLGEVVADFLTSRLGSMAFLGINFLFFLFWILINTGSLPVLPIFDSYPFHFLTFSVSLEAIFLATVVLISQRRAAKVDDLREEVDLEIDIIAEQELTNILRLLVEMMRKQGMEIPDKAKIEYLLRPLDTEKVEKALTEEVRI